MLEAGYTSVCEFHYLHNNIDGSPYPNKGEIAVTLARAAENAGISMIMLPVFYNKGGFSQAITKEQRRFYSESLETFVDFQSEIKSQLSQTHKVGLALHSLRAASLEDAKESY